MAMKVGELYETMELKDSGFKRSLSSVGSRAGGLMKTLGKAGLIGTVAGVGAAFVGMAAKGTKNMKKVHDLTKKYKSEIGATEEETQKFSDTITSLHKQNTDSYEELASAVTTLKQKHGSATEGMAQDFLDYAKVTEQDTAQAIKSVHSMQKAWNLDLENSAEHLDKLKSIQAKTGASASDMQKSLAEMAPSMRAMNMSFDEGVAMMGQFTSQGVEVQQAERGMRQMMDRMADPTKQQAEAMRKLGVEVTKTEDGFKTSEGAVKQLISRLSEGDLSAEEMSAALDILGKRSGTGMVRALQNGEEGLKSMMETLQKSEGSVKEASETYDKQLGERWTLLKRQYLEPFMETLGTGLLNVLEKVLGVLENWAPKISSFFETFKTAASDADSFVGAVKNIGSAFKNMLPEGIQDRIEGFMEFFNSLKNIVKKHIPDILEKFSGLKEAVGGLIGVFSGLTSGEKSPVNRVKVLKDTVKRILEGLLEYVEGWIEILTGFFQIAEGVFSGDWDKALEGITTVFEGWKEAFFGILRTAKDTIVNLLKLAGVWEDIKSLWKTSMETIRTTVKEKLNAVKDKVTGVKDTIVNTFTNLKETAVNTIKNMMNSIKEKMFGVFGKVTKKVKGWAGKVGGFFQGLYDKVTGGSIIPDMMNDIKSEFSSMARDTLSKTGDWVASEIRQMSDLDGEMTGMASSMMSSITDTFSSNFQAMIEGTKNWKTAIVDTVSGTFTSIKDKAKNFLASKAGSWLGGLVGQAVGGPLGNILGKAAGSFGGKLVGGAVDWLGSLFGLAEGGLATDRALSLIGEGAHDEAVLPLSVETYQRIAEGIMGQVKTGMAGGYSTANIVFQVDGETLAKAVEQPLADRIRIKGGVGI